MRFREQLSASSERVPSVIAEGFGQRRTASSSLIGTLRGSCKETRTHLALQERYVEVEKMATGLIKHLNREDPRQRG